MIDMHVQELCPIREEMCSSEGDPYFALKHIALTFTLVLLKLAKM